MADTYNVMVTQYINSASSFNIQIDCPFQPRKLRVDYIFYINNLAETLFSVLRCQNLLRNEQGALLGTIQDTGAFTPPVEFCIGYPVTGNYVVEVLDAALDLTTTRSGYCAISLTFIK